MATRASSPDARPQRNATRDDLRRVLGDLDDPKVIAILDLAPTLADLEEATVCLAGDQDILARHGHPASMIAVKIAEILSEEEEEDRTGPRG